ncbi:hypothetical protein KDRO_F03110 [Kluyveromyces lactis]|nr:hypothetical protein KDRO_F03110 [Kluyveromyces lactis]
MSVTNIIKVDGEVQTASVSYAFSNGGDVLGGTSILSLDVSQIINVSASTFVVSTPTVGTAQESGIELSAGTASLLLPSSLITDSSSPITATGEINQNTTTQEPTATTNSSSTGLSSTQSGNAGHHWKPRFAMSALLFVSSLLL